ncbi:hypothetical protein NT239_05720 [Chitinibacter sp. SCUT-21]|uniref:hypothetical protein n=1 Tax=Chitinibacter sp. SCUT-21 TaxID=2970891 RepID=UPI0035A6D2F6
MLQTTFKTLAIALCLLPLTSEATHSWAGYHWARTGNPFTIKLGDNVNSTWDSYLATASNDWSMSNKVKTTIVTGSSGRNCKAVQGTVQVCNSNYGQTGWLGIAQVWISGTHIVQGTTKMNDTYFNTSTYNKPEWRALVMCQEVGHTFGLAHQDENFSNANLGSCMDYTNAPGGSLLDPNNMKPNWHDYEELDIIYGHVDSSNSYSASASSSPQLPPAMNDIDFSGPAQWGKLMSSNRNGQLQTYELDFGGGHKLVTHVFWIEPHGQAHEDHTSH